MGANSSSTLFVFVGFVRLSSLERTLQQQAEEGVFFVLSSVLLFDYTYFIFRNISVEL